MPTHRDTPPLGEPESAGPGRLVTARAPTRVDFGGGWTDVPPYSHEQGGCVCNLAIARHATVRIGRERGADVGGPGETALARAALARAGLHDVPVAMTSDFPVRAGLGGSSAAGVAMVGALAAWQAAPDVDRAALAEQSRRIEVEDLGVAGGRQDHYAAAFGGALRLDFHGDTRVTRIPLDERARTTLERRLVVVYTGESRISGETITAVLDAYAARTRRVVDALARMKALAEHMADALGAGDVDALGALVGEHWTFQRALHPKITTPRIDALVERSAAAGAIGAKALGASGGGCVLLIAAAGRDEEVRAAARPLGALLDFTIDRDGLVVETMDGTAEGDSGDASGGIAH
jgi:D-glycero-alpha-D-manno-heptose-7-phosphate kinase